MFHGDTTIKITLIHNPAAGDGSQPSADQILKMIRAAGHKVNYQSSKEKKWKKALEKSSDIVAVAGGDGTVGKVARSLVGSRIPVAILPLGTANNIAHSIGLTGKSLNHLVQAWRSARRINFDVGVAKGPWGSTYFIESFGVGLLATAMARLEAEKDIDPQGPLRRESEIRSVLKNLKEQLRKHEPKKFKIRLDDQDLSGDYILLEAVNIRYVGPNLDLVPGADTNDGLLDVVLLSRREESRLSKYLTKCLVQRRPEANLSVLQARRVQIKLDHFPVHIDDKVWPRKNWQASRSKAIDIEVGSHTVVFLAPRRAKRQ